MNTWKLLIGVGNSASMEKGEENVTKGESNWEAQQNLGINWVTLAGL